MVLQMDLSCVGSSMPPNSTAAVGGKSGSGYSLILI